MRRPRLQGGVIIVPSALTIANLFFGFWAVISAAGGNFERAGWLIVFAGIFDLLDGRVARVTQTGSRFGEELDSLVDAISFGVAPALIMYFLFLRDGSWGWVAAFFYIVCAVIRLARFNVEQAGHAKVNFHGLPSPSAGMTLATFYPFSQTAFFEQHLAHWPWPEMMTGLMVMLGLLMMSHVLYPVIPKFGFRTAKGIATGVFLLTLITLAITVPHYYFFTALVGYVAYGLGKATVLGFFERLPDRDPLLDREEDDEIPDEAGAELRELDYGELSPWTRQGMEEPDRETRGRGDRRTAPGSGDRRTQPGAVKAAPDRQGRPSGPESAQPRTGGHGPDEDGDAGQDRG